VTSQLVRYREFSLPPSIRRRDLDRRLQQLAKFGTRFVGGTGETACREWLVHEFQRLGMADVHLEKFDYLGYSPIQARCSIAGSADLECVALQSTASTTAEGLAVYVGGGSLEELTRAENSLGSLAGRVVVATSRDLFATGPSLADKQIAGFVHIESDYHGLIGRYTAALEPPSTRPPFDGKVLPFPAVTVSAQSGQRLLAEMSAQPTTVVVTHEARYEAAVSYNVVASLGHCGMPDGTVYVGAHYDSAMDSPGAWDNGTGVAGLLTLAAAARSLGTKRHIVFIAFGAEEPGLWGSLNYVAAHRKELAEAIGMLNLDTIGSPFRAPKMLVASPTMVQLAEGALRAVGWTPHQTVPFEQEPQFDYAPFFRAGVPVAGLLHTTPKHPFYHSPGDTLEHLDLASTTATTRATGAIMEALVTARPPDIPSHHLRSSR